MHISYAQQNTPEDDLRWTKIPAADEETKTSAQGEGAVDDLDNM